MNLPSPIGIQAPDAPSPSDERPTPHWLACQWTAPPGRLVIGPVDKKLKIIDGSPALGRIVGDVTDKVDGTIRLVLTGDETMLQTFLDEGQIGVDIVWVDPVQEPISLSIELLRAATHHGADRTRIGDARTLAEWLASTKVSVDEVLKEALTATMKRLDQQEEIGLRRRDERPTTDDIVGELKAELVRPLREPDDVDVYLGPVMDIDINLLAPDRERELHLAAVSTAIRMPLRDPVVPDPPMEPIGASGPDAPDAVHVLARAVTVSSTVVMRKTYAGSTPTVVVFATNGAVRATLKRATMFGWVAVSGPSTASVSPPRDASLPSTGSGMHRCHVSKNTSAATARFDFRDSGWVSA